MSVENPQFAESPDGRQLSDAANWSGNGSDAKKKRSPGQKTKRGDRASLPALTPTAEDHQHLMIAEAAYFRAERRGFTDGYSLDDWLVAEAEIKGVQSS